MTYDLQLRKGGRLFTKEWNSEKKDYIEHEVCQEDLTFHSNDTICLNKNIILRDVFLLINKNIEAFSAIVGCPFLCDLIGEAFNDLKFNIDIEEMAALRLSREIIIQENSLYFNSKFNGIGKKEYVLEFIPVNELVLFPLILNEEFIIEDESGEIYFKTNKPFTLSEMLNGILDELSFMGPPSLREFASSELKKRDDVENYRIYTNDALENKIKDIKKNDKISCCVCGKDSRSQYFGKPSNMCKKCFISAREN